MPMSFYCIDHRRRPPTGLLSGSHRSAPPRFDAGMAGVAAAIRAARWRRRRDPQIR
jgi:hypothetical protein